MPQPPDRPFQPTNQPATPQVHVCAGTPEAAAALVNQLQHLLGTSDDFALQASTYATLNAATLTAGDAVLLLPPPLAASNTQSPSAANTMMELRNQLAGCQQAFQVLFSQGDALAGGILAALCNWFPHAAALQAQRATLRERGNLARWNWSCDTCSDPECELRLFKGLIAADA